MANFIYADAKRWMPANQDHLHFDKDADQEPFHQSPPYDLFHSIFVGWEHVFMSPFREERESFEVSKPVVADANDLSSVSALVGAVNAAL